MAGGCGAFPAKRDGRGANGCACWRAVARPFRLWRVDRGEIGRGTGHRRRDRPAVDRGRLSGANGCHGCRLSPVRQTIRTADSPARSERPRTCHRPAADRGRQGTGTPQAARQADARANPSGTGGRKGGRLRRISGDCAREPVRRTCPADRHGTGGAVARTCPASRPARSPQTAHRNATGGAARLSGAPVTFRRRDCPRTCPARSERKPERGKPSGGRSRQTCAQERHRARQAGRKGEPVRHGRAQWRAVAARFRRLCPRPVRRDRGETVRRAMRMYAYASGTRRTVAARLSGETVRRDRHGRTCHRSEPVRRHRARADGEPLRQIGHGLPDAANGCRRSGTRRTVAPVTCPA